MWHTLLWKFLFPLCFIHAVDLTGILTWMMRCKKIRYQVFSFIYFVLSEANKTNYHLFSFWQNLIPNNRSQNELEKAGYKIRMRDQENCQRIPLKVSTVLWWLLVVRILIKISIKHKRFQRTMVLCQINLFLQDKQASHCAIYKWSN